MSLDYSLDDSYISHHSDLDMNWEVSPLAEQPGAGSENPTTDSHADISIRPHVETSGPTRILCQSSYFGRPADFTMTFEEISAVPKTIEALAKLDKKFIAGFRQQGLQQGRRSYGSLIVFASEAMLVVRGGAKSPQLGGVPDQMCLEGQLTGRRQIRTGSHLGQGGNRGDVQGHPPIRLERAIRSMA